jgi:hypothetical protein
LLKKVEKRLRLKFFKGLVGAQEIYKESFKK